MRKLNESGSLLVPLVIVGVLCLFLLGFGVWAFANMQDFKNNSDQKSAQAVKAAEKSLSEKKAVEFAEKEKSPYKSYSASSSFGNLSFEYPKTWSAYIIERGSNPGIDGYMFPNFVPDITSKSVLFALRFQVIDRAYDASLKTFEGQVKSGKVSVSAYQLPKVSSAVGSRIIGNIVRGNSEKKGTMVMLPLRDKTIEIWTEGDSYQKDFSDVILPSMTFVP